MRSLFPGPIEQTVQAAAALLMTIVFVALSLFGGGGSSDGGATTTVTTTQQPTTSSTAAEPTESTETAEPTPSKPADETTTEPSTDVTPTSPEKEPGVTDPIDELPHDNLVNPQEWSWNTWEPVSDNVIRIHYSAGVRACYGEYVEAEETADSVTVRLFTGSLPDGAEACTMQLVPLSMLVHLDSPLGERKVLHNDGEEAIRGPLDNGFIPAE